MTSKAKPITLIELIDRHDDIINAATGTKFENVTSVFFIQQLEQIRDQYSNAHGPLLNVAEEIEAALTYLVDATAPDVDEDEVPVLLRKANQHLNNVDPGDLIA